MNEQEMRTVPPEEGESADEEVILPPLPPLPVEVPSDQVPSPVETVPPETEEEAPTLPSAPLRAGPEADLPKPEEEATTPPPSADLPDQEEEEERTFKRPRTIKDLREGMVLEGKVTSVAIYGAFVDVGVGREGLVHLSQLSDQPISSPTEVVQIGDMVTVRVLNVDPRSRRISLTMREKVEPQVDKDKLQALTPGTIVEGTVTSLARFGVFVDIGVGRDGLVPTSQLDQGDTPQAGGSLQVGERVRVRVLEVERKSGRIRLSMRNLYDPEMITSLRPGQITSGRVTSLAPFGAFIDLGVGKDGLIHISEMGDEPIRHPQEILQINQEVEVRVVDVDPETQRISLSLQLEEEEAWVPEVVEEEEELPAEATLEDLVARFSTTRPAAGRIERDRGTSQAEKEKRALREALQRTLEEMRTEEEED